jgi:hypothetical protein
MEEVVLGQPSNTILVQLEEAVTKEPQEVVHYHNMVGINMAQEVA